MRLQSMMMGLLAMAVIFGFCGWSPAADQSGQPPLGGSGVAPSVFFPEKTFEFEPVIEGAKVLHDFSVMNKGTLPLLITNVRTG